jgi:NAD(P)-dependent dehydrogenase (short-subunit alcohol dehydrogenase family)
MQLENRKVIVMGGSSGIGLGIAREAAKQGAEVVIVGRSREKLEQAQAGSGAARLRGVTCDVGNAAEVERCLESVGVVDHVVLTAVEGYYRNIRELDIDRARRTLETKIVAALAVAKYARFGSGASLTLTAGVAAQRPGPGASVIAAVNGAVEALVRALALELRPVRVNALSPGWVDTPFWDSFAGSSKEQRFQAQAERLPVGRVGTPEDLASAALLLMTYGFITGEVLRVDGGHRLV